MVYWILIDFEDALLLNLGGLLVFKSGGLGSIDAVNLPSVDQERETDVPYLLNWAPKEKIPF